VGKKIKQREIIRLRTRLKIGVLMRRVIIKKERETK
jgi:hypothetical protein